MSGYQATKPATGGLFAVLRVATACSGVARISLPSRRLPEIPCNIDATPSRPEFLGMFLPHGIGSTPRFCARSGDERAKQFAPRSHNENLLKIDFDWLGQLCVGRGIM